MNTLMNKLFGKDYLQYHFDKKLVCFVNEEDMPTYQYQHSDWEEEYKQGHKSYSLSPKSPAPKKGKKDNSHEELGRKMTKRCLFPTPKAESHQRAVTIMDTNQKLQTTPTFISGPLKQCTSDTATRQELSVLKLPPVTNFILASEVVPIYSTDFVESNPYCLTSRPPEAIVEVALQIINQCSVQVNDDNTIQLDDRQGPSGVTIGKIGRFSSHGIKVLSRYCSVAKMQWDYKNEISWLRFNPGTHSLTDAEINFLCSFFKTSPHDPQRVVASLAGINVDFKSLSTLVGEPYIDNFVINFCLKKAILSKQTNSVLCLPSEALVWLDNHNMEPIQNIIRNELRHPNEMKLIVMPVHMEAKQHWGLACVDLQTWTIWYDDGMKIAPPANLAPSVGKLVNVLSSMFPSVSTFNALIPTQFPTSQHIKRMSMPQQRLDGRTAGSGSCGMDVILLAWNIIDGARVPPLQFGWTFEESNYYRKQLMLYILR